MEKTREKVVIKTSIISIIANIILAGFKAFVGLLANSIAFISMKKTKKLVLIL